VTLKKEEVTEFRPATRVQDAGFLIFLLVILVTRCFIFFGVNLQYIDFDQPLLWLGASDYSKGIFYEPRFYGQAYNTFLESLLAVPMIWMNVPVYVALPVITHLVFLFPPLFTALYLRKQQLHTHALIVLATVVCMPAGYHILTGIPRGFVTGILFSSFFIISLLEPKNMRWAAINTVLSVAGYFANQNSIIISAPVLFFVFLKNADQGRYYMVTALSLLTFVPLYLLFDRFYVTHPGYIVHGIDNRLSLEHFLNNISNLPDAFVHISFFTETSPLILTLIMLALLPLLWRSDKKAFYAYLVFFVIILVSRFSEKSTDGSSWPFFSNSRLYLGVPVIIYLFMCFVPLQRAIIWHAVFFTGMMYSIYKFPRIDRDIEFHLQKSHWNRIPMASLGDVLTVTPFYREICKREHATDLLVSNDFWLSNHIEYGGPALFKDFPDTYRTYFERRFHVRQQSAVKVPDRLLLISAKADIDKVIDKTGFHLERLDDYGLFLVSENRLTVDEIILRVRAAEDQL
jgi:hypothetical protein